MLAPALSSLDLNETLLPDEADMTHGREVREYITAERAQFLAGFLSRLVPYLHLVLFDPEEEQHHRPPLLQHGIGVNARRAARRIGFLIRAEVRTLHGKPRCVRELRYPADIQ